MKSFRQPACPTTRGAENELTRRVVGQIHSQPINSSDFSTTSNAARGRAMRLTLIPALRVDDWRGNISFQDNDFAACWRDSSPKNHGGYLAPENPHASITESCLQAQ